MCIRDSDDSGLPVNETTLTTYKMFQSGKTPAEIAASRGLAASTIVGHLATCLEKGGHVDITCQGRDGKGIFGISFCCQRQNIVVVEDK